MSKLEKTPNFAFKIMSLIHDNSLLWIFKEVLLGPARKHIKSHHMY